MQIALLTDRLRVEERLLIESFSQRGHEATLVGPSSIHVAFAAGDDARIAVAGPSDAESFNADIALDRSLATTERAALGALIGAGGTIVLNRPATTRLLADRLAAVRHLTFAGIPIPDTIVSFGEAATFDAIATLGFPVLLKSITTDRGYPIAFIEDRDAAEAMIEHRVTLGDERGVLVQRFVAGPGHSLRLVVVGQSIVAIEQRASNGWRPAADSAYESHVANHDTLVELGHQVIERLGSGAYGIEVVEADDGPRVVGVENLVDFRTVAEHGVDIAGYIADFALSQLAVLSGGTRVGE
jgi:[lysine-biosynthesis-protein LysW]--L-2-aminoadipate ligase